jgi:hypothetical protein
MSLVSRIASVFRTRKLDEELDEELFSHMEMRVQDNMAAGMSAEEAQLDARRRFGNPAQIKESTRAQRMAVWLETVLQDARFGFRMLRRTPGFTLVAVLTVALTIGAATAVFTIVNSVLLRPLPYENSDRLIVIATFMPRSNEEITASAQYTAFKNNSRISRTAARGADKREFLHDARGTAHYRARLHCRGRQAWSAKGGCDQPVALAALFQRRQRRGG